MSNGLVDGADIRAWHFSSRIGGPKFPSCPLAGGWDAAVNSSAYGLRGDADSLSDAGFRVGFPCQYDRNASIAEVTRQKRLAAARIVQKRWRERNKEAERARQAARRADPEVSRRAAERHRIWAAANPARMAEYAKRARDRRR